MAQYALVCSLHVSTQRQHPCCATSWRRRAFPVIQGRIFTSLRSPIGSAITTSRRTPRFPSAMSWPRSFKRRSRKEASTPACSACDCSAISFDFFTQKLAVLHSGLSSDAERFQAAFGRTLFLHLTRRDKVEQSVSYVKARQTGLWHAAPDGTELERLSPPQEPAYDAGEIRARFEEVTAYDRDWERWFATEKIDPLRVTYESLSTDPTGTLRRILDRLGLDREAAADVQPGVAKLADGTSRDWVARFAPSSTSPDFTCAAGRFRSGQTRSLFSSGPLVIRVVPADFDGLSRQGLPGTPSGP